MVTTVRLNEVLAEHTGLDIECLDRMCLNGYVGQTTGRPRRDRVHRAVQRVRHMRGPRGFEGHLRPSRARHDRGVLRAVDEPAAAAPDDHRLSGRLLVGTLDASDRGIEDHRLRRPTETVITSLMTSSAAGVWNISTSSRAKAVPSTPAFSTMNVSGRVVSLRAQPLSGPHSPPSPTMAGGCPPYGSEILGSWPCSAPYASP